MNEDLKQEQENQEIKKISESDTASDSDSIAIAPQEKAPLKQKKAKAARASKATRQIKNIPIGRAYIQATYNNTIVNITDLNGNTIAWSSAGHMGFRGPKKATPYAATILIKELSEKIKSFSLRDLYVFVSGVGAGRESAIRSLNANGFNILSIKDITPLPHNGPRPPRPRRV